MFHSRVVEGIMRFEKPIPLPESGSAGGSLQKRGREDVSDEFKASY